MVHGSCSLQAKQDAAIKKMRACHDREVSVQCSITVQLYIFLFWSCRQPPRRVPQALLTAWGDTIPYIWVLAMLTFRNQWMWRSPALTCCRSKTTTDKRSRQTFSQRTRPWSSSSRGRTRIKWENMFSEFLGFQFLIWIWNSITICRLYFCVQLVIWLAEFEEVSASASAVVFFIHRSCSIDGPGDDDLACRLMSSRVHPATIKLQSWTTSPCMPCSIIEPEPQDQRPIIPVTTNYFRRNRASSPQAILCFDNPDIRNALREDSKIQILILREASQLFCGQQLLPFIAIPVFLSCTVSTVDIWGLC
jgi:hypothetical protein